jgi:hypothetical protein
MGAGTGMTAFRSCSRVGVSRMAIARPHEEQKRTFSEDTAPHPEQVTIDGLYRSAYLSGHLACGRQPGS